MERLFETLFVNWGIPILLAPVFLAAILLLFLYLEFVTTGHRDSFVVWWLLVSAGLALVMWWSIRGLHGFLVAFVIFAVLAKALELLTRRAERRRKMNLLSKE